MSTKHETNEEAVYYEALGKAPAEREAYLQAACGQDATLLARIRSLLKAHDVKDNFLESAPWDSARSVTCGTPSAWSRRASRKPATPATSGRITRSGRFTRNRRTASPI